MPRRNIAVEEHNPHGRGAAAQVVAKALVNRAFGNVENLNEILDASKRIIHQIGDFIPTYEQNFRILQHLLLNFHVGEPRPSLSWDMSQAVSYLKENVDLCRRLIDFPTSGPHIEAGLKIADASSGREFSGEQGIKEYIDNRLGQNPRLLGLFTMLIPLVNIITESQIFLVKCYYSQEKSKGFDQIRAGYFRDKKAFLLKEYEIRGNNFASSLELKEILTKLCQDIKNPENNIGRYIDSKKTAPDESDQRQFYTYVNGFVEAVEGLLLQRMFPLQELYNAQEQFLVKYSPSEKKDQSGYNSKESYEEINNWLEVITRIYQLEQCRGAAKLELARLIDYLGTIVEKDVIRLDQDLRDALVQIKEKKKLSELEKLYKKINRQLSGLKLAQDMMGKIQAVSQDINFQDVGKSEGAEISAYQEEYEKLLRNINGFAEKVKVFEGEYRNKSEDIERQEQEERKERIKLIKEQKSKHKASEAEKSDFSSDEQEDQYIHLGQELNNYLEKVYNNFTQHFDPYASDNPFGYLRKLSSNKEENIKIYGPNYGVKLEEKIAQCYRYAANQEEVDLQLRYEFFQTAISRLEGLIGQEGVNDELKKKMTTSLTRIENEFKKFNDKNKSDYDKYQESLEESKLRRAKAKQKAPQNEQAQGNFVVNPKTIAQKQLGVEFAIISQLYPVFSGGSVDSIGKGGEPLTECLSRAAEKMKNPDTYIKGVTHTKLLRQIGIAA